MPSKIKIAFLLSVITKRGGIGRVTSIVTDELEKTGLYDIHIISYSIKEDEGYSWNKNITFHNLIGKRMSMKKGIIKATQNIRVILKDNDIKILVAAGSIVGPLASLGTYLSKTKLIYWSHSSFKGSTNNKYRVINEHFTAIFAKYVISLTKEDQINYKKLTLARKVFQIYNPIDSRLNNRINQYNPKTNKIISVGRLTHQKNFEGLIDIASQLSQINTSFSWDIYGSGEDEEMLSKKIKDKKLENKVFLKGQSNNLYNLYNNYSLMVMTSRYEGFPMSLIEGMACKLPLISFDIQTGPNEIIRNDINGYLIKPFENLKMANKINSLLLDSEKSSLFSSNNKLFLSEYKLEFIISQWESIFKNFN